MDPLQQQQQPLPTPPIPPPVPTNAQQAQPPQPTSMLERLREQVSRELMPDPVEEAQRRARTFGAALMGSRGSFFEGLSAGQQAIEQQRSADQQARNARLQQLEQQAQRQTEFEAEQAQRQAELALRQAEFEYNRDPNNPANQLRLAQAQQALNEIRQGRRPNVVQLLDAQGNVVLLNAETGQEIRNTGLRSPQELRNQPRALGAADFARLRDRATAQALRDIPSIPGVTDPPSRIEQRNARTNQLFEEFLRAEEQGRAIQSGGSGATAPPPPAAGAPARVLQYSGPQPQPRQQ
jgi:hypothetical protein